MTDKKSEPTKPPQGNKAVPEKELVGEEEELTKEKMEEILKGHEMRLRRIEYHLRI